MKVKLLALASILFHSSDSKLENVQIIWRHGERNPYKVIPTDYANAAETWPEGIGELTNDGIAQAYQLGQQLKKTYGSLLPHGYDPKKTRFMSGDENRTIASGAAVLGGLFPPTPSQTWNPSLAWFPVAQHSDQLLELTEATDMIKTYCPALESMQRHPKLQAIAEDYQNLYDVVNAKSGFHVSLKSPLFNITDVWDILYCETERGRQRPDWATDQFYQTLREFYFKIEMAVYDLPNILRMSGGWILGKVAQNLRGQKSGDFDHKIIGISGHDLNLLPLLSLMPNETWEWPWYTANLRIELHSQPDQVKMFYQNGPAAEVVEVEFRECPDPCSLHDFLLLADRLSISTSQWFEACGVRTEQTAALYSQLEDKNLIIAVLGVAVGLVSLLLLLNLAFLVKHGKAAMSGAKSVESSYEEDPLLPKNVSVFRRGFVLDQD